jgi:hypothetical protein
MARVGALTRGLGCLLLLFALAGGWLYRDRVLQVVERVAGKGGPAGPPGRPGTRALGAAKAKTDSLARGAADSVVLSAAEVASLLGDGLDPTVRRQLDSLDVTLGEGRIDVGARLSTARLPRELIGPLGFALRDRERVRAGGPLRVTGSRRGEWVIDRLEVRGVPLPADAVAAVLGRALGEPGRHSFPIELPRGVREIRIHPTGAVLVGVRRS